jgi:hypothetical protein
LLPSSPSTETRQKKKKERKNKKSYGQEAGNEVYSASKEDREGLKGRPLSLSRSVRKNKGRVVALSTRESARGFQKIEEDEVPKRGTLRTTTCRAVKKSDER